MICHVLYLNARKSYVKEKKLNSDIVAKGVIGPGDKKFVKSFKL